MMWPQKKFLWVLFFLIKLAVITTPIHLVLGDVNEPITNKEPTYRMIQCDSQCTDMGEFINTKPTKVDTVMRLVVGLKNDFLTEWTRGWGQLLHFISNPPTVDSVLANNMAVWSQSVEKYYFYIQVNFLFNVVPVVTSLFFSGS